MLELDPSALASVSLFSTCSPEQRARVLKAGRLVEHPAGDVLTQQGAHGHRFHLIVSGEVAVERDGAPVARLGRGEFVGEIGLLGGGPATATVRCTRPTACLTIDRLAFWQLLEEEPAIALRILEIVCRRLERERWGDPSDNLGPA